MSWARLVATREAEAAPKGAARPNFTRLGEASCARWREGANGARRPRATSRPQEKRARRQSYAPMSSYELSKQEIAASQLAGQLTAIATSGAHSSHLHIQTAPLWANSESKQQLRQLANEPQVLSLARSFASVHEFNPKRC